MNNTTIKAVAEKKGSTLNVITEMHISKWIKRNFPESVFWISVREPALGANVVSGSEHSSAWALHLNLSEYNEPLVNINLSVAGIFSEAKLSPLDQVNIPVEVVLRDMLMSGAVEKGGYLVLFDPADFDAKTDESDRFYDQVPVLALDDKLVVVDDCFRMPNPSGDLLFGYNENGLYLSV